MYGAAGVRLQHVSSVPREEGAHFFSSAVEVPLSIRSRRSGGAALHSVTLKQRLPAAWLAVRARFPDIIISGQLSPHGRSKPRLKAAAARRAKPPRRLVYRGPPENVYHRGALGVDAIVVLMAFTYADGTPDVARMTLSMSRARSDGSYVLAVQVRPRTPLRAGRARAPRDAAYVHARRASPSNASSLSSRAASA